MKVTETTQNEVAGRLNEILNGQLCNSERPVALREVADKLGMSISHLRRLVSGGRRITSRTLVKSVDASDMEFRHTAELLAESTAVLQHRVDMSAVRSKLRKK